MKNVTVSDFACCPQWTTAPARSDNQALTLRFSCQTWKERRERMTQDQRSAAHGSPEWAIASLTEPVTVP
jgi:hypothetical protein